MYGFMTTGTAAFLQQLMEKHPKKAFQFMRSGTKALLYYEDTNKKSIFVSGRSGAILFKTSHFASKGFVVMYHIPVPQEETAVFEYKIKSHIKRIADHPNVNAIRFLKENKSIYYIIIIQWKQESDYNHWKKLANDTNSDFFNMAKLPASFTDRPFTNTYYMIKEKE